MICQLKAPLLSDLCLKLFDGFVVKFFDLAAVDADQVVVMIATIQFEDGIAALKVMANHESGRFKLSQYAIDSGKPDFFPLVDQGLEDAFRAQMLSVAWALQDFEDFDTGQGDLEACVPDVLAFQRMLLADVKTARIGYDDSPIKANP